MRTPHQRQLLRIHRITRLLERTVQEGGWFDLVLHVDPDLYEQLPGEHETLAPDGDGGLVFAKDIPLAAGTLTVETAYEQVAA